MIPPFNLGLVGLGKIARNEHLPAIAASPDFNLVAVASPGAKGNGFRAYQTVQELLSAEPELDALVMCQPPQYRFDAARAALLAGKHVFLEKPPGATVTEVLALREFAARKRLSLFASWHSRAAPAVAAARSRLIDAAISKIRIVWKEDVQVWHPSQAWLWRPGGLGVFDPGINALSILTEIVAEPVRVTAARFAKPQNAATPIAVQLEMETTAGSPIDVTLDFREGGSGEWSIDVETDRGNVVVSEGGKQLTVAGAIQSIGPSREYPELYRHFAGLIRASRCEVDVRPLQLVADAFLVANIAQADAVPDLD